MAGERILVVDDEPGVRAALEGILADEGFEVVSAASGEDGLEAALRREFDAVLLDVWLPGIDGLETLRRMRERRADAEVVMISGHGTIDTAVRATKLGAFDFVEKPLSLEKTLLVLRNALRQRQLEKRNRGLLEQLSRDTEVVGRSAAAEGLRREIEIAAGSDAPVLIHGERGSGREAAARRIHASGRNPDGPFVALPASALDAAAAAEALFGTPAGAGRLALAAGGTLLIDGAEHLDEALQRRMAGWIGSQGRGAGAVRVMASTGPDVERLGADLRQAVDVARVRVPALRERREDVELLAERAMRRLAREYGRAPKRLGADALAALKAYAWPGNLRELDHLTERLLLATAGEVVSARDLPEALGGARPPAEDLYRDFATLAEGRAAFERYWVERVLAEERGQRDAAARRLGIPRKELDVRLGAGS